MENATQLPDGLLLRSAEEGDWGAMERLSATCFGSFPTAESSAMWRSMLAADGALVVADDAEIVAMSTYLDLQLTVPGAVILPAAGVSWVAVSPTHRRRGLLRAMLDELHCRISGNSLPVVALLASEGGIYGRFGYGPATVEQRLRVQRKGARLHPDAPDVGGVRVVAPSEHRRDLEDIYERWRRRTPGGLYTPPVMWTEVLADRESARGGGSPLFALLHRDGFAMYRVHDTAAGSSVSVTKLTAVTDEAHIALWRVLLGLDLMDTITVDTHPGDLLPYLLEDPRRVETASSSDALWLRISDIPTALQARTYGVDLSAVVQVDDSAGGTSFALTIVDGVAEVTPTDHAADIRTDRSVLGSIYLGAHRPSAFAAASRLRCNDAELLAKLDLAFASPVPAQLGYGF